MEHTWPIEVGTELNVGIPLLGFQKGICGEVLLFLH